MGNQCCGDRADPSEAPGAWTLAHSSAAQRHTASAVQDTRQNQRQWDEWRAALSCARNHCSARLQCACSPLAALFWGGRCVVFGCLHCARYRHLCWLGSARLSLHVRARVRVAGAKIVVRIPADARVRSQWTSVLNSTPGLHSKILRDLYSGESAALASEDVSKYQVKKLEVQVVNVNNVKAYSVEITFDVSNDKAVPTSHRGTLMVTSTGEVHSYIDDPNFDE